VIYIIEEFGNYIELKREDKRSRKMVKKKN